MIKKLLVIQHVHFEGLGAINTWTELRGWQHEILRFFDPESLIPQDISAYHALIILGGPMNVENREQTPWLKNEISFINKWLQTERPVLGICLGAQLLTHCLGGQVRLNEFNEIGWFPIQLTDEAKKHPLFKNIPEQFTCFHWHSYCFDPPEGSFSAARSPGCLHQAFVHGKNKVGLQFHLETMPHIAQRLTDHCKADLEAPGPYIQNKEQILSQAAPYHEMHQHFFRLLDNWSSLS